MEVDNSLLAIILVLLTWSAVLNLLLTLRIAALVRPELDPDDKPLTLPIGEAVPVFEGQKQLDRRPVHCEDFASGATLMVFLSPDCSLCRETVPQILKILPGMKEAGITLWIVTGSSVTDSTRLLGDLTRYLLRVDAATIRRLNPRNASPFYIMIDDRIVQASNFVGDENWRNFIKQMEGHTFQQAAL